MSSLSFNLRIEHDHRLIQLEGQIPSLSGGFRGDEPLPAKGCRQDEQALALLCPVILKVPEFVRSLQGRDRVRALSVCARKSLLISLAASGLSIETLEKDEHGAPIPVNGVYWSISHKDEYVAGIAARCPVGIDLERVKPVGRALFNKVCRPEGQEPFLIFQEDPMAVQKNADLFFRIFTAKEAVVKSQGVGLSQLAAVKVTHVIDRFQLEVAFHGVRLPVFQTYWRRHMISLTCASHTIGEGAHDDGLGDGGGAGQGCRVSLLHPEIRWMMA